jgi:hypothetical protein
MAEQSRLQDEMSPGRGAWLYGAGGCGISALLRQAMSTPVARSLPDGVVYMTGEREPHTIDDVVQRLFNHF